METKEIREHLAMVKEDLAEISSGIAEVERSLNDTHERFLKDCERMEERIKDIERRSMEYVGGGVKNNVEKPLNCNNFFYIKSLRVRCFLAQVAKKWLKRVSNA